MEPLVVVGQKWRRKRRQRELKRAAVVPVPRVVIVKDRDLAGRYLGGENYAKRFSNTTRQRLGISD